LLDKKIVVVSAFNTFNFRDCRVSKEWIDTRINIFMNYTLNSLKNQTNQDFLAFLLYDPTTEGMIFDALSKYEQLPENIQFINYKYFNRTMKEAINDYDYLYLVRIDCDDMYHLSYIQQLQDFHHKAETKAIINQKGHLYDSVNIRLANYFFESPPFYTLIYETEEYKKGLRYKLPGGHAGAIQLSHEIIDKTNFLFHIHSTNTLNRFEQRFNTGGLVTNPEDIKKILVDYLGNIENLNI
jgi:hypothetical protein